MAGFDFHGIQSVEFGVCLDTDEGESYRLVPCVTEVQEALKEMLDVTRGTVFAAGEDIQEFSPAEKYAANERLRIDLMSDFVGKHREVFEAANLPTDTNALSETGAIVSYFAIFRDSRRRKLMAFRRAGQFKGVLKKRLIRFSDDALRIVPDNVFKLDTDFDFLIFDGKIFIWRPNGFVFAADMDQHIAACAMENVSHIEKTITCVDFAGLRHFVSTHKRAMRLVAAIKSRNDLTAIAPKRLRAECKECGIPLVQKAGQLFPEPGSELPFLMLLDRRRYTVTLIDGQPETYEAASRHLANPAGGGA
jgi:Kiwa KwaB-like protein